MNDARFRCGGRGRKFSRAVMNGERIEMLPLTVKLLTCTEHPIETMYTIWRQSRSEDAMESPCDLAHNTNIEPTHEQMVSVFRHVMLMDVPPVESITFTFLIENVSIALREQIVRHRVGHSFWCQSMRVKDMSQFATDGAYHVPAEFDPAGSRGDEPGDRLRVDMASAYRRLMIDAQSFYRIAVGNGVPAETARMVIPLAATHRMTWSMNLAAFKHIVSKRSCWIAQLGLWAPMLTQMLDLLCRAIDPCVRELLTPPCMKGDRFTGCTCAADCTARVDRSDPGLPCPLYGYGNGSTVKLTVGEAKRLDTDTDTWRSFIGRDPMTGHRGYAVT